MLSNEFRQPKWSPWYSLQKLTIEENMEENIHNKKGVYVIKGKIPIGRIKGKSDIIYIGQGSLKGRLYAILGYFYGKSNERTWPHTAKKEIFRLLSEEKKNLFISYRTTKSCKKLEKRLLHKYEKDHIELPPLNKALP
jgi:hypothetical protein